MKKRVFSCALALTLILTFIPTAYAVSEEATQAAQALYELGLFSGVGNNADGTPNFDLDRTPTRQEAITMLVRLLGKEDVAKNEIWDIPFIDVDDWARPYIGYAYNNGLTSGISENAFGANDAVTASQYLTFILRALGYESGIDFQWDSAWELSDQIGLTDGQFNFETANFTRRDVAIVSNNALDVWYKDGSATLRYALFGPPAVDYSYLAITDFHREKRDYPVATALIGYVQEFTNVNGEHCVLSIVYYKIISNYSIVTLHNITTGETIDSPDDYYGQLAKRSYGSSRLKYYDMIQEVLTVKQNMLIAMQEILITGNNPGTGTYVSPEILNL